VLKGAALLMSRPREPGLRFVLPDGFDKAVSFVEVGPDDEAGLAEELNTIFGSNIRRMKSVRGYVLVHEPNITLDSLMTRKPFVDPIIHRGALNESLASKLKLPYDHVFCSMLLPGTSDAEGTVALEQALLAVGRKTVEGDQGFSARQYFIEGKLTSAQRDGILEFLSNPKLHENHALSRREFERGVTLPVPIVTIDKEPEVRRYDVAAMSDGELMKLNRERRLAGSLDEMRQFAAMYRDEAYLAKRREHGLDHRATDVELETWFGLRSEHCFHKEFNASQTLDDKANDPVFERAYKKGWLGKNENGEYTLQEGIFKEFIRKPAESIRERLKARGLDWIVGPLFSDNAGAVLYDKDFMYCIKKETHNSPFEQEPKQGAKTGIDGVNRDIWAMLMGTFECIANFFDYAVAVPSKVFRWVPKGKKQALTLLKGGIQGVREGGNESQIATLGGSLTTDARYFGKGLLFAETVGWSPTHDEQGRTYIRKEAKPGDIVYVAGQPVGIDGIHGATESSLVGGRHISLGHVQADFSYEQKKMSGFTVEAARQMLIDYVQDMGAMGLGSSSIETARETGGIELDLDLHPQKYKGMQPWQLPVSETQDRMCLSSDPKNDAKLKEAAQKHGTRLTAIGKLTDSGYAHLRFRGETVAYIPLDKLFNKEPRKRMHATWTGIAEQPALQLPNYSFEELLGLVISRPDVASREWIFRQKDSSVKGGTIQGPLIGPKQEVEADATIQKPLETQGRDFGALAYARGLASKIPDAYHGAQSSFLEMVGKIVAVGGALPDFTAPKFDSWAVCGNYCQPNSDGNETLERKAGEHNLAQLLREGIGVREAEEALGVPVISGKDSMKCTGRYELTAESLLEYHAGLLGRTYRAVPTLAKRTIAALVDRSEGLFEKVYQETVPEDLKEHIKIIKKDGKRWFEIHDPSTYNASAAVKIEDYRKCVNRSFKQHGDLIYVIGETHGELAGSELLDALGYATQDKPLRGSEMPKADLEAFVRSAGALHGAIDAELIASASYIHRGGLATTLTKDAMAGEKGAEISLAGLTGMKEESFLYSQSPGRWLVTVAPEDKERFEGVMAGVACQQLGTVINNPSIWLEHADGSKERAEMQTIKKHYQRSVV
jgi:phosphoribosylformylglycinamidine synthase subunit PurSL